MEQTLTSSVEAIIKKAGKILSDGFGTAFSVRNKQGVHNLVTEYDVRVEEFLFTELSNLVPGSGFIGEEGSGSNARNSCTWVVDPLDGTVNFAHGIPIFCVSIAAVIDGHISLGVIHQPIVHELFTAVRGKGAKLNGTPIRVSDTPTLRESMLVTGFPYNVADDPLNCIEQLSAVLRMGIPIRRLGSAALDLAYTAAGRFDGFWEARLNTWDMAAGVLLVREAGGTVTHYDGIPFVLSDNSIVATNGHIHAALIEHLQTV